MEYGRLYLNNGRVGESQLISENLLKKIYQPHVKVDKDSFYGYAFKVTPYHGITLVEHSGGQPGVATNFGFLPEKNIAVAVLTNVAGAAVSDIWLEAVNTARGFHLDTKRGGHPVITTADEEKKRFVGEFASKEGQHVVIKCDNGEVIAEMDDEIYSLNVSS